MSATHTKAAHHAIRLAEEITLTAEEYASMGNAILGIRDSGKSYSATFLAEQLLTAGFPIVAFDPIGVWHNLRCAGKGPGFEVVVAGGEHGDFPITPDTAEGIMRKAMQTGRSIVVDLYDMKLSKADWRRIVETAVRLLLYENKTHGLRHIFIEEAAEFVPQMVTRDYATVYAEVEKLARMGGNAMLGYTLINQRSEQVNKAVLELCDTLFLHRQKGKNSLTALTKWLDFSGGDSAKIVRTLPMLSQGECYVWATGNDHPVRLQMPTKRTFHPNRRQREEAGERLEMPGIREAFAIKKEPAMKVVKSPIPGLQHKIPVEAPAPPATMRHVFRPGEIAQLHQAVKVISEAVAEATKLAEADSHELFSESGLVQATTLPPWEQGESKARTVPTEADGSYKLSHGQRKLLITANTYYPRRLSAVQLGTLAGFTPSTVRTYMPGLRAIGFFSETAEGLCLAPMARQLVEKETPPKPKDKSGLVAAWMARLGGGEAIVLKKIWEAGKKGFRSTEDLQTATGYTNSTLRTYLPTLRNNRLVEKHALVCVPDLLD